MIFIIKYFATFKINNYLINKSVFNMKLIIKQFEAFEDITALPIAYYWGIKAKNIFLIQFLI